MKKTVLFTVLLIVAAMCYAQDQTINGYLTLKKSIILPVANSLDNQSPGLVAVTNDDFPYKDRYLNHYGFGFYRQYDDSRLYAYISNYFGIDFFTEGKNRLTISRNGYVGIGIESPKNLLDVNGTIRSKEVKIEATGWSDFVFGEKYQLPSLSEVENHIKEHKHLPDIPSEREVIENGISVGEMQAKLLQKIEELTLYVIGQQKEIESLKQKLKEQE